jgi:hypothetical protein
MLLKNCLDRSIPTVRSYLGQKTVFTRLKFKIKKSKKISMNFEHHLYDLTPLRKPQFGLSDDVAIILGIISIYLLPLSHSLKCL